jgi:hypothetical protein
MSDTDYRDKLITQIAESQAEIVSDSVISTLQGMSDGLLSGDDSGLESTWDEICVQVQGEPSIHWSTYEEVIESLIEKEIENLSADFKIAICLQIENDSYVSKDKTESCYSDEGVIEYIKEKIKSVAMNCSDDQVREYLDRNF